MAQCPYSAAGPSSTKAALLLADYLYCPSLAFGFMQGRVVFRRDLLDGVCQYCFSDVDENFLNRSGNEGSTDFPADDGLFQSESRNASIRGGATGTGAGSGRSEEFRWGSMEE